jgi:cytochrome c
VIARGDHLVHSVAGCAADACHSADLGGGKPIVMGPVGSLSGPNITSNDLGTAYSDGELARLVTRGIKKDGRSVCFMPVQDLNWLSDADVVAVISYVRSTKPSDRPSGTSHVGWLGKILDRQGKLVLDVAREIAKDGVVPAPAPEPTAVYGGFIARLCKGCHGEHLSGGRIPGAPGDFAVPLNLTPDATGLKEWTFEDFDRLMKTGVRKNGEKLDPLMPIESWKNFDDTEMRALWAYLRALPPMRVGQR